jgi:ABC-type transport system involved in multi-copper enzyme maturation permease subunit
MNLLTKLFTIEWIKVRKRSVFWVVIVAHATILGVAFGGQQYMHHLKPKSSPFTLPADWQSLIGTGAQIGMLMLFIGIALLTASEATWRTQRQNVIDGLSRGQYFSGKVIVVLLLAVILWVDISLMGIAVAPFGGPGALSMPVFSSLARRMLPNTLLYFIAIGTTAFMFGMIASSSGAALGMLFAFIIVSPILTGVMSAQGGAWPAIARFLPLSVFENLTSRIRYDEAAFAQFTAMAKKMDAPLPLTLNTSILATFVYIAAFIGITWLAFRTRDL